MRRRCFGGFLGIVALLMGSGLFAGPIVVPNASFESPATGFVSVNVDAWQKSPKPDWYDEGGGFFWNQLIGLFKNTAPTSPDHIDNCDGNQAIWLFAVPEVALFQDYETVDADDPGPTHGFNALYEVGKSYQLTVGVVGTGGGMQQGVTLDLSLYYRDAASNKVPVAVTSITNSTDVFTNNTYLIDFTVTVPEVKAPDPWAGTHIGIQMLSTVTTNLQGGYWDLDNVRLEAIEKPSLSAPAFANGLFQFKLQSAAGLKFEILSSTNIALPLASWTSEGVVTNTTGNLIYSGKPGDAARFYGAVQLTPQEFAGKRQD